MATLAFHHQQRCPILLRITEKYPSDAILATGYSVNDIFLAREERFVCSSETGQEGFFMPGDGNGALRPINRIWQMTSFRQQTSNALETHSILGKINNFADTIIEMDFIQRGESVHLVGETARGKHSRQYYAMTLP